MKAFVALFALVAAVSAEADPAVVYSGLAGYPYAATAYGAYAGPYVYGKSAPCVNAANQPVPCAQGYAAYLAPHVARIYKREAEAEADPALLYAGAYATPYAYGAFPYTAAYGYPYAYAHAAPAAVPAVAGGYAAAGRYVANSAGVVHVAKREAEAEADPALLYAGAYAGYPYAYGYGLPLAYGKSAPCVNAANQPVPCASGYAHYGYAARLFKREAEAEADPAYFATGYAHPYAYGAYPYAYGGAYATGLIHTSRLGVCTNYLGAQVPC